MAETNKRDYTKWFRELKSELKKIVWPNRKTVVKNTLTVLGVTLAIGAFIWIFDAVAMLGLDFLLGLFG